MRITALLPQEGHAERVNVHVDGAFRCGIALELVLGAGLHVGDEVDEPTLATLARKDLLWKAREAAMHLLSYRARSEAELRRRLLRKEYPADVVDECVAELAGRGLVDDGSFASAFVRDRVRLKPRGTRRLVQELRAKGVDPELAQAVVQDVLEDQEVSEAGLAGEAAAAWARRSLAGWREGRPADFADADARWNARHRLYAYLARRGFGAEAIREAVEQVVGRGD